MSNSKRNLTEEQQQVVHDAMRNVATAYAGARSRLLEAGVELNEDTLSPCNYCSCRFFIFPTHLSDDPFKCGRATCPHDLNSHGNVR